MSDDVSKNLRSICTETGSIAQVCRKIGINRQQFNPYVNSAGLPSAHNLRRIARYLDLPEADLFCRAIRFHAASHS
ncbi:helix-turn-helix domain-containing protein [Pelagivirga sediminicola]|uniref:helix-turn-helix domain-containing protein n=1 Tax=Pelagivirga sediminicola TaxID=2170575 RepID=UPI001A9C588B